MTGRALPAVDKALRLRCTLSAADHTVIGVRTIVVHLGTAGACDRQLELVHDTAACSDAPPRYFELTASLAPVADPASRIPGTFVSFGSSDGTEFRIAGIMDASQDRVELPEIALRAI